jgi:hypothetical protein
MHYQYPLETLARRRSTTSQLEFAREACRTLSDSDEILFEPYEHGLAIFAANEDALEAPARILRELYGDFVELRHPQVRYIPGRPPQEPIMSVRITTRADLAGRVLAELRMRSVRMLEQCIRGRILILRAEAPLASLLGLPARLDAITDGTAVHSIRLLRYSVVVPDPQPAA